MVIEAFENGADFYLKIGNHPDNLGSDLADKIKVAVQRRRENRARCESEERFRNMAERSSDLIIILDERFGVTYASPSSYSITGYDPEDLIGKPFEPTAISLFSDNIQDFLTDVRTVKSGLPVKHFEMPITKKDGTDAFVEMNVIPIMHDETYAGAQVSMQDITERRKVQGALRESEEKFRTLSEYSLDGTLILDPLGKILYANTAAGKIIDMENLAEIIGSRNVMEFIAPDSQDEVILDFKKVAHGVDGYIAQYKIHTVNHEERWVESIGKLIYFQNAPSILISLRDITLRKQDEAELIQRSTELQLIFSNMINAFIVWESVFDDTGKYVSFRFGYFNDAYARISKLRYEDVCDKDVFEVWPTTEESWVEMYGNVAVTGNPQVFDMYHEPTCGWYHCNAYRPTESPDQICVIFEDITERKQTEELLRETNAYLDNLITNANVPIIVWDPSFLITRINHSCELLIGRSEQEVLDKPITILFPQEQIDSSMRLMYTTLEGDRWDALKIDIQHQNGSVRSVFWNSSTIYGPDGSTPVAIIAQGRDVTSELLLEKAKEKATLQIQQNIAQLAILNDGIRNPLTVILLYAEETENREIIEKIHAEIKRIDEMVSNLDNKWIQSVKILNFLRKHEKLSGEFIPTSSLGRDSGDSLQDTIPDKISGKDCRSIK